MRLRDCLVSVVMCGLALSLIGCTMSTVLINPRTDQWIRCEAHGWGYIGAPMASSIHERCVSDYKRLGYVPLPESALGLAFHTTREPLRVLTVSVKHPAVQEGDVLESIDDIKVPNFTELLRVLSTKKPGATVNATLTRGTTSYQTKFLLIKREDLPIPTVK